MSLPTLPLVWHITGLGDFNGGGFADLALENTSTGQRAIWFLKNGVQTGSINLPTLPVAWHVADHQVEEFLAKQLTTFARERLIALSDEAGLREIVRLLSWSSATIHDSATVTVWLPNSKRLRRLLQQRSNRHGSDT